MSYQPPPPGYPQYPYYQPPPYQPPPPVDPAQLRPGRIWYWLTPIPAIISIAAVVFFVVMLVDRLDFNLERFSAGSTTRVHADAHKQRGIYAQTEGTRVSVAGVGIVSTCTVRPADGGTPLTVHPVTTSFTLTLNSETYDERFWFEASKSGDYLVSCQGKEGTPLAVGPHLGFRALALPIIGIVVSALLGLALTVLIPVITAVRRSSHKRRIQQAIMAGQPPPY